MRKTIGEIFSSELSAREAASAIDSAVNCLGFNKKEQWQSVVETGCHARVLDFVLAWIAFQASEAKNGRYDGRNALSCQICAKLDELCDMQTLRGEITSCSKDVDAIVKALLDLHRTLKQTLSGFCLYVLERATDSKSTVTDAIDSLCGAPFTFFAERGFDRRTVHISRSEWHRMPFI